MRANFGAVVVSFMLVSSMSRGDIVYVDATAAGNNDGSSWCDAFVHLQDALTVPIADGEVNHEIRVAAGTYTPDQGGGYSPGDPSATFQLFDGVKLSGGFAGCGSINPDARDLHVHRTILSGDLSGDDQADFVNYEENSFHVVNGSGTTSDAILDGVTVISGNGNGGGLFVNRGVLAVFNTVFRSNAGNYGGAVFVTGSSSDVSLDDCTFLSNKGVNGGAIFTDRSVNIDRGLFVGNHADNGGAVRLLEGGKATVRDSTFASNTATNGGGAFYGSQSVTGDFDRCVFLGNQSDRGGAFYGREVKFTITNSLFLGNTAGLGGGLFVNECFLGRQILNTSIIGNSAEMGGGIYGDSCSYKDGYSLINSILWDNKAREGAQVALDGCLMGHDEFNIFHSDLQGGFEGLFVGDGWNLTSGEGNLGTDPKFSIAPSGTWTHAAVHDVSHRQTTLTDDFARWPDGVLTGKPLQPNAGDSLAFLIVGNSNTTITVWGDASQLGQKDVAYSVINPRLDILSPCIDVGFNTSGMGDFDLERRGRVLGPGVDIGAYEFGDCDNNGVFDSADIVSGEVTDCDGNAIPDACDLMSGLVEDCTRNGIPDQCEGEFACDSDRDGVPDDQDACTDSDLSATIKIGDCETNIANSMAHKGCTLADQLAACNPKSRIRGHYLRCVASLAREWRSDDFITLRESARLLVCAARE